WGAQTNSGWALLARDERGAPVRSTESAAPHSGDAGAQVGAMALRGSRGSRPDRSGPHHVVNEAQLLDDAAAWEERIGITDSHAAPQGVEREAHGAPRVDRRVKVPEVDLMGGHARGEGIDD